ncbi:MAG: ATP-binding protein [Thermoproteales archaeon]|nr:ATP-binding protein [Thermoproteales archaeon]
MVRKFIDREDELKALRERLSSRNFELIIVYGRRRIGKTRLVLESLKNSTYIYYLAVESGNLRKFKEAATKIVPEVKYAADDWEAILHFLKNRIIVLDEFPNLIKEDKGILSLLQRVVDLEFSKTRSKLILLGSSVSMMESKVLSYKSPLYGRRTSTLRLKPLRFHCLTEFFPEASLEELIEIYGFADGIPFYLERVKYPFWKWLDRELKRPDSFVRYEIDFLMKYEFEDTATYKRILEAVAFGKTKLGEIKDYIGARRSDITPYLRNLTEAGFITREVPITEPPKSRKGRYHIKDNFTCFWFRFIYPNLSAIEQGIFNVDEIKGEYNQYLGHVFEKVATQFMVDLAKAGKIRPFSRLGRWWRKNVEIDLVALNTKEQEAMFVEVKWAELTPIDVRRIFRELEKKAVNVEWNLNERREYYCIIARKIDRKKELREKYDENFFLFDLDDFKDLAYK